MFEEFDKLILAGLGTILMTREKAEKIFDEYVSKGKAEKDNRTGFVKELMDHVEKNRKDLEKLISDQVSQAVDKLNLSTKEDIQRLDAKIELLLNKGH